MTTTFRYQFGAALVLTFAIAFGGPLGADETSGDASAMSRGWTFDEPGGEALFAHVCAACHQADARGAIGAGAYPALAADANLASKDYVLELLLEGRGAMPPIGRMMSDAQIADVINYVRGHFGNAFADAISPSQVAAARAATKSKP
jgi:mono/diheme cytochrome c family protein